MVTRVVFLIMGIGYRNNPKYNRKKCQFIVMNE